MSDGTSLINGECTRLPDWRSRLQRYINEVRPAEFRYGQMDCALFTAGAVRAMTGHDPAASFRGTYTDLGGGIQRLRKVGAEWPWDLVDRDFAPIAVSWAQVGDIALIEVEAGSHALGIFLGEMIACCADLAVVQLPRSMARRAWRVG